MDNTYLDRIQLRRAIIESHSASTVACNPIAEPAVLELYTWIFGAYLPRRFPRTFQLLPQSAHLHNVATNTNIPLRPASASTALRTLGENVDTDFLLLLPEPPTSANVLPIYHLQAFVVCFPSGFSTCEKLGQSLSGIHAPVPGYKAKLAPSMDRFFARLEPGKAVMRANWTITTDDRLFCETGTHLRDEEPAGRAKTLDMHAPDVEADIARQRAEVVIADCRLRTERQTLHRLPETGAVVFAFKTYLHRLDEVKGEADGAGGVALAEAIEGLTNGSVPGMNVYKRGVVWSEKVLDYLRSEEG